MYNKELACMAQENAMSSLHCVIKLVSDPLWDGLVWILLGVGLFFTLATGLVQFRLLGRSVKEMTQGRKSINPNGTEQQGITAFQAFVTGLASRVGTGNVVGVAIAVTVGGPGAVFWMWMTALIGMSSAFAESSLAQLFKVRDKTTGLFRGGPAYYIEQGLGQKWLGVVFSISLIVCFGWVYNAIQSNVIGASIQSISGMEELAWKNQYGHWIVGAILVACTASIIFGGVKRVARAAEYVVPIMAVMYLVVAVFIVLTNLGGVPTMFRLIFNDAFTFQAAGGGLLGGMISQAMMLGIKRGLYSNEAGQGSAPNAAAAADVKHPVSQGLIQMLGVFVDTIIVCSCTAFIILLADPAVLVAAKGNGTMLTQVALVHHVGEWGRYFLVLILLMFCFSTIIGNYAYAEANVQFLFQNKLILNVFRILVLGFVYFGAVSQSDIVWEAGDLMMGIMALINLIVIALLYKLVLLLLKDYRVKLKLGKEPEFKLSEHPVLKRKIKNDIW